MEGGSAGTVNEARDTLQMRAALIEQQREVSRLAARDREVRAHEQAHASVGGAHASAPSFEFTKGPNGVRYATGGHVDIDISVVHGDPHATLKKMQTVVKAALAPAQPSPQDRAVAARASQQAAQARAQIAAAQDEQVAGVVAGHNQRQHAAAQPVRAVGSTAGAFVDITA